MLHGEHGGFEDAPRMTSTGLYEDFESAFSGVAMAVASYQQAKNRSTSDSGDMGIDECLRIVKQCLAVPAQEYVAFLEARRPEIAKEVLHLSSGPAIVKINAAIRTFNMRAYRALHQLDQGERADDALRDVIGSLNELYAQMGRSDAPLTTEV